MAEYYAVSHDCWQYQSYSEGLRGHWDAHFFILSFFWIISFASCHKLHSSKEDRPMPSSLDLFCNFIFLKEPESFFRMLQFNRYILSKLSQVNITRTINCSKRVRIAKHREEHGNPLSAAGPLQEGSCWQLAGVPLSRGSTPCLLHPSLLNDDSFLVFWATYLRIFLKSAM